MERWPDLTFTPLVVVELAPSASQEAVKWLLGRMRGKPQSGGLESGAGGGLRPQTRPEGV